ncbi:MAG: sensor histidine kinase [Planctomycetota bacterium]|jgi:two-component system phosphate regulon sensor histidine kinase PhoR
MAVTLIAAGSLSFVGLAELLDYAVGTDGLPGGYTNFRLLAMTCRLIGLVGVICLGWCGAKLAGGVESVAEQLESYSKCHDQPDIPRCALMRLGDSVNRVTAAVAARLAQSSQAARLEEQVRDLQVRMKLSAQQKRHVEAIIYSIRDAVIVLDESGKLLMANEAAGSLFNFDHRNSQYKPLAELIDDKGSGLTEMVNRSGHSKGRAKRRQIEFLESDKVKTFDCIVSRVYDDEDQVCGVVAVLHDITREKEISKMKNDFVSHVSHELKTPLASLTAYSEMLCEGEADNEETRKEFYLVIQDQAHRLNRLIEDILNISRIESGLIKVDKKPVSLTVLIEEQLRMIRSYAEEKNIQVIAQKPIVLDQVYADEDMISQVIVNLLSNAVKYTPSGGSVTIESEVDEIAGTIRVKVTDTGVGIPEDEIEHVFDKFYRVSSNKAQAKGTGLGLNLVKQIVEKVHNGRLFVSSKPGVGSTFGFDLPLATAPATTPSR